MSILDDLKGVVSTIQKIDNIELYRQILDLQKEVLQLVSENVDAKAQIATLNEQLSLRRSLRFEYNAYWSGESLEASDGPFCAKCWDTKQQLVRMLVEGNPKWSRCHACEISMKMPRKENGFDKSPEKPLSIGVGGSRRRDSSRF